MSAEPPLTDLQLEILRILWDRREGTAAEVQGALAERGFELAPTTVATLLSRLERRGVLAHRRRGRRFVYAPKLAEQQVRASMLDRLTSLFFGGDEAALVSHLVSDARIHPRTLARIREQLAQRSGDDDDGDEPSGVSRS